MASNGSMNAATAAGYVPTCWRRLNESSRFSTPPPTASSGYSPLSPASTQRRYEGLWSVTVRANWRIIFRFEGTDAFDVELIDYH